jgi:hypothetical protein
MIVTSDGVKVDVHLHPGALGLAHAVVVELRAGQGPFLGAEDAQAQSLFAVLQVRGEGSGDGQGDGDASGIVEGAFGEIVAVDMG